ncbi:hypothetical protein ACLOJK_024522 [Asimina triloba]
MPLFLMRSREQLRNLFEACHDRSSVSQLHCLLLKTDFLHDSLFATKLTSAYAEHSSLKAARQLFEEIPRPTVFLWNAILRACYRDNQWLQTLQLFRLMNFEAGSERFDNFTASIVLKACAGLRALEQGKEVHGMVRKERGIGSDVFVGTALVEMYSKCGKMGSARRVFSEFPRPDAVLWTAMVTGYQQHGDALEALSFFSRMMTVEVSVVPEPVTLVSVVSACAQAKNVSGGRSCHGFVVRRCFHFSLSLSNALLNFYSKVGCVKDARNWFTAMANKDVISWSSMIDCYAQSGKAVEALDLFYGMIEAGIVPNSVTVVSALQACAVARNLDKGREIHDLAIREDFELDFVVSTALVDMYMKCSCVGDAINLFQRIPKKDVVTWAALISGYAQNGLAHESLGAFRCMLHHGTAPDAVTIVKILAASSQLGILRQALSLHGFLVSSGFDSKMFVGAALVDLYSKCGSLDQAIRVFKSIREKDVVIWSSMIAGYGFHGLGGEAIQTFNQMVESLVKPNSVTFVSILSACSHSGLVEEGIKIFKSMIDSHNIVPTSEHYGIIVDILGRRGELAKAAELIERMPMEAGQHVWGALLGSCRLHNNLQMGEFAAKNLLKLDPDHLGYYVLLSNIYAVDGRWDDVAEIRCLMKEKAVRRTPGSSSIEVGNVVNTFLADDRSHPESQRVYWMLRELDLKMREKHSVDVIHDAEEMPPLIESIFHMGVLEATFACPATNAATTELV